MNFGFAAEVGIIYSADDSTVFVRRIVNMTGRSRQTRIWKSAAISIAILAALVIVAGCKKKSPKQSEKPDIRPNINATTNLNDVIRSARTWRPAYTSWYGKTAPDFTLTDLTGKKHKLSDYRGKDVVLVFWATWCKYCVPEIPHLIELRNTVSEDKLAILAISNEGPRRVREFVINKRMNYTVLLEKGDMPAPFGVIKIYRTAGIPCSFFIDPEGKIKLATVGILTLESIKAILQAE